MATKRMARVMVGKYTVEGATKREAKARAKEFAEKAMVGTYDPIVLSWRGITLVGTRDPDGWSYGRVEFPESGGEGWLCGATIGPAEETTRDQCRDRMARHLAQIGWDREDGLEVPAFVTRESDRQFLREEQAWHLRYQEATEAGMPHDQAYRAGCDAIERLRREA